MERAALIASLVSFAVLRPQESRWIRWRPALAVRRCQPCSGLTTRASCKVCKKLSSHPSHTHSERPNRAATVPTRYLIGLILLRTLNAGRVANARAVPLLAAVGGVAGNDQVVFIHPNSCVLLAPCSCCGFASAPWHLLSLQLLPPRVILRRPADCALCALRRRTICGDFPRPAQACRVRARPFPPAALPAAPPPVPGCSASFAVGRPLHSENAHLLRCICSRRLFVPATVPRA